MGSYNPIELGRRVRGLVSRVGAGGLVERRYYRFRGGRWYGGIASADVVGCDLRCGFCWSWNKGSFETVAGFWQGPGEVASRLLSIARGRGYRMARVTGGEPLLVPEHLLQVVERLRGSGVVFVVETNGLALGLDKGLAERLVGYDHVVVRVSIKGCSPSEFHRLTMAEPGFFELQLRALENLVGAGGEPGVRVYPAVMLSFSTPESIKSLLERLGSIHPGLVDSLDPEYVILYPHVRRLMERYGLRPRVSYEPRRVPGFMV